MKQAAAQGEGGKDGGPGDPTSRAEQLGKMVDFLEGAASGTNPGRYKRLRNLQCASAPAATGGMTEARSLRNLQCET